MKNVLLFFFRFLFRRLRILRELSRAPELFSSKTTQGAAPSGSSWKGENLGPSVFRRQRLSFLLSFYLLNSLLSSAILLSFLPSSLRWSPLPLFLTTSFCFFILLVLYTLLYFPLSLLPSSLRIYSWIIFLEAFRTTFLLADAFLFRLLGLHFYSPFLLHSLREPRFLRVIGANVNTYLSLAGLFLLLLLGEWLLWRIWLYWRRPPSLPGGWGRVLLRATVLLLLSGLSAWGYLGFPARQRKQLSRYLPGYKELHPIYRYDRVIRRIKNHLAQRRQALRYPLRKLGSFSLKKIKRPHILLIATESLRGDMLNKEDMPLLTRFIKRHPTLVSQRHYSGGHQTWEGVFSLLYSLAGHHRYTFKHSGLPPYPLTILKKLGYRTVLLTASSLRFEGYEKLVDDFDQIEDLSISPSLWSDRRINQRITQILEAQRKLPPAQRQPHFFFLFYYAPHYPYLFPWSQAKFRPFLPRKHNQMLPPAQYRLRLWNRYRNSVRFIDNLFWRLRVALRPEMKAGKLAWAFVGDHGEEFWDHAQFGHASRRLNNARVQTPLVLYFPGQKRRTVPLSSHPDIFPTLFRMMGVPLAATAYSDGHPLHLPRRSSVEHINGYNFPYSVSFLLVTPRYKIFARRSNNFSLEINAVRDLSDRKTPWRIKDIREPLHQWMRAIDRFYPGFQLWRSSEIRYVPLWGYPFPETTGPIRSPSRPSLRPWDRLQGTGQYVTRTRPRLTYKRRVPLGKYAELIGYNISGKTFRLGEVIYIEYIFRCLRPPPNHYWRLFFHLGLKQPPYFAGISHPPVFGKYPLHRWRAGEYIRDVHRIITNSDWRPGKALIYVGIYNKKTGKRVVVPRHLGSKNRALVTTLRLIR